jgi:ribosomal protein S11
MATAVGLNMKITADTAGIGRGVNQTEKMLGKLSKSASSAAGSLRALVGIEVGTRLAAAFTSAARAAVDMASRVTQSIAAMDDLSQRTGVSTDALQGFQVAADLAGVQNLEGALQKVSVVLGDAAAGSATAQKAFANIGLTVNDLLAKSPEEQFRAVASAIGAIKGPAAQAAAAVDLFGKSGVELLPLFASNLKEIEAQAQKLGMVLSEDQVGSITEMDDALLMVRKTFDGIIGQVTANLAPVVTDLANQFLGFVEAFEGVNGQTGGTALADSITDAFLTGADYLASILDPWINYLIDWAASFSDTTQTISAAGEYFQIAADIFASVFYGVRAVFNGFSIAVAQILKILPDWIISNETLANFQKEQSRKMKEDFERSGDAFMGRNRPSPAEQPKERAILGDALDRAAQRRSNRNSPEAAAERERQRAARAAERERAAAVAAAAQAAEEARKAEEKRLEIIRKADEEIAKVEEERAKRAIEIEGDRLDALSRQSNQALGVSDVRSGGISEILRIASGREDPAVEEYRKQLSELRKIDAKLGELRADRVDIVGNGARAA